MKSIDAREIAQRSPLSLAFVGDSVMDLIVRESLVLTSSKTANALHQEASRHVCAKAQSARFLEIEPLLTEVESGIATRARNAHHHTTPKNCTLAEYRNATALEAVIGYNWLIDSKDRCIELSLSTNP